MKSIYPELALYGGKIEYARTENAFFPLSEVRMVRFPLLKMMLSVVKTVLGESKSPRSCKLHYWLKSYCNISVWVNFGYWWSLIKNGLPSACKAGLFRPDHKFGTLRKFYFPLNFQKFAENFFWKRGKVAKKNLLLTFWLVDYFCGSE